MSGGRRQQLGCRRIPVHVPVHARDFGISAGVPEVLK
jgi:hypothetical protein